MTTNAPWSLEGWCGVLRQAENLPPVLHAIVAWMLGMNWPSCSLRPGSAGCA
ncbi:hypothetical protein J2W42_004234 [Rhizobium tibeticum]|nr:hypothetical protein [Rhizobium tibeticum]